MVKLSNKIKNKKILIIGGCGFIGQNLTSTMYKNGFTNIKTADVHIPRDARFMKFYNYCDVINYEILEKLFTNFKPQIIINLAANPDLNKKVITEFPEIYNGVKNIIKCVNKFDFVENYIETSTQYVHKPWKEMNSLYSYDPYTVYGECKAYAEKYVIDNCKKSWLIVRPTNIWGPHHPNFKDGLWKYIYKGLYIHPGFTISQKNYCFVDNASYQYLIALNSLIEKKINSGAIIYLVDEFKDNSIWLNDISINLRGKKIIKVPLFTWQILASFGDFLNLLKIKFPMNSARLSRIRKNEKNLSRFTISEEKSLISYDQAIKKTTNWLKLYYSSLS